MPGGRVPASVGCDGGMDGGIDRSVQLSSSPVMIGWLVPQPMSTRPEGQPRAGWSFVSCTPLHLGGPWHFLSHGWLVAWLPSCVLK